MKTKIFLGLVMICFLLGSCFDDESAKNVEFLKPIQINDFSTSMELYVSQGGRLKIKTLAYKEGMDDAALSFEWKLQGHGQHETLGNTMILDTVINVPMNREAYSLLYTVTDTENELTVTKRYYLYVTGQYEAGLLVADTKDEQTSDLHLIIGKNFNRNYSKHEDDRVFENIYSINNGTKISELVTDMKSVVAGYLETSIATKHSVEDLSPLDNFTVIRRNNDMFIKAFDGEFVVGGLNNCARGPYDVIAVNGHIHKRTQYEEATTYGVGMLLEDLTDDYYVTHYLYRPYNPYPGEGDLFGIAYDQKHRRFLAFPHFRSEDNLHIFRNTSADGKQDPNQLGNKECIYIGYGPNVTMYAVLKDSDTGLHEIWTFNMNADDKNRPDVITGCYILDGCPDIEKAHKFQSQAMEEVMYYATDDKVYAVLLTASHPQALPKYEANPGEKITGIQVVEYCEGKLEIPNTDKPGELTDLGASNHMMLVMTYNETTREGKVIAVPILSLGTGDLIQDKTYHREYGPFGRILKTTCYHTR